LERRHLDLKAGELKLDPEMTKTRHGRLALVSSELRRLLTEQVARVDALQREHGVVVRWVFPHLDGVPAGAAGVKHRPVIGERIKSFRRAWATACTKAGRPGLLVHDLRRSGIRNLVRAGVSQQIAMRISGHKSANVFARYDIVSPDDLRDAARRLEGHKLGHNRQVGG
jgi:integrase